MTNKIWALFEAEGLSQLYIAHHNEPSLKGLDMEALVDEAIHSLLASKGFTSISKKGDNRWLAGCASVSCVDSGLKALRGGLPVKGMELTGNRLFLRFYASYIEHCDDTALRLMLLKSALPRSLQPDSPAINANVKAEQEAARQLKESIIRNELLLAQNEGRFYMVYQPILCLKTGKIASVEALLRIRGGKYGPGEFIAVAEDTGAMEALGEQALALSGAFWKRCQEEGINLRVAVNVSALQLRLDSFSMFIKGMQFVYGGCNPQRFMETFEFEITESQELLQEDYAKLHTFYTQGYAITLDDFGAGSSSLLQLLKSPPGKVKFDREMLPLTKEDPVQLGNLIEVAHSKGSKVVIEGVETKEHLRAAISAKADYAQGYFMSRPLEEYSVLKLLDKTFDLEALKWI